MKVSLLNDSFPPVIDGVANVVLNYADIMTKEQLAEVMVCTPKYPNTDYSVYPYKVTAYQSFDTTNIVKGYRAGNPFDFKELKEMADFNPDIIHTHCPVASAFVARMLKPVTNAPVILTYHTKFDEDIAKAVKSEFLQKETSKVLINNIEACDEVWVVSEGAGEHLVDQGFRGTYRVMNNGVDFAKGRVSEIDVIKATEDYDLPEGIPVFLFVGRMIEYKGVGMIIDALSILNKENIDFRMVFVGGGADLEKFKQSAREKGLLDAPEGSKVIFVGPVYDRDKLRAWNTRADVFVFPSTYDTNGIVVREAAACGLASILIKGSCAAEGVTNDRNGFLIDKTAEELAQMLRKIVEDIDHVHDVGQHAMDEIYISWTDSVHDACERYGEILDLKKSGDPAFNSKYHVHADSFLQFSDDIANTISKMMEKPYTTFDNMLDNANEFADRLQSKADSLFEKGDKLISDSYNKIQEELNSLFTK